jgi:peptidoglycan LD-endopeptidase LytH
MALNLADRLLTIAVTATLTSAVWIVVGTTYVDGGDGARPATVSPSSAPSPSAAVRSASPPPASPATGSLLIPVAGIEPSQLTDTFNDTRDGSRPHEALDILAKAGTPVIAAAPGTVEKLFLSDAGGITVYVRSADRRTIYYYAHLQAYAPGLKEGQAVKPGDQLGTVGSTGNANPASPHLHFAMMSTTPEAKWWEDSTPINPYPLLIAR